MKFHKHIYCKHGYFHWGKIWRLCPRNVTDGSSFLDLDSYALYMCHVVISAWGNFRDKCTIVKNVKFTRIWKFPHLHLSIKLLWRNQKYKKYKTFGEGQQIIAQWSLLLPCTTNTRKSLSKKRWVMIYLIIKVTHTTCPILKNDHGYPIISVQMIDHQDAQLHIQ